MNIIRIILEKLGIAAILSWILGQWEVEEMQRAEAEYFQNEQRTV